MPGLIDAADRRAGDAVEALIRAHHRRRLRRAGWPPAGEGANGVWAADGPAPRAGNRLEVHIDGAEALPLIAAAIEGAQSSVHVAGWHIAPGFALRHDPGDQSVRELLAAAAQRVPVRVLMWAGAPVPLFHPTRAEVRTSRDELRRGTRVRCEVDAHNRPMHCHHEKLVIVDGSLAFVGGIDLTDLAGNRFDRHPHPSRAGLGWHDAAVRLTGPAVVDVADHFAMRWAAITDERLPPAGVQASAGTSTVQVVRTVPEGTYPAMPRGDFSLLQVLMAALRGARRLIYIENQFLWSSEVVRVLAQRLAQADDDLRIVIVLPARPNNGADDTRGQLEVLGAADRHRRLIACTIGAPAPPGQPVYVHAKVTIIDDRWLSIGSGNLNEHSLYNDTEMNVVTDDAGLASATRERLWAEHLGHDRATGMDPVRAVDELWRPALEEGRCVRPLPRGSRRASRLLGPLQALLVDG